MLPGGHLPLALTLLLCLLERQGFVYCKLPSRALALAVCPTLGWAVRLSDRGAAWMPGRGRQGKQPSEISKDRGGCGRAPGWPIAKRARRAGCASRPHRADPVWARLLFCFHFFTSVFGLICF